MPILKRNDLSKQFELVVQQEIKNHNDQMLATNLSINEFRQQIIENKKSQDAVNAQVSSQIVELNIHVGELSEHVVMMISKLHNLIDDLTVKTNRIRNEFTILTNNYIEDNNKNELIVNRCNSLYKEIEDLKDATKNVARDCQEEISSQIRTLKEKIDKTKQDILPSPSDSELLRIEIEEKMATDRVDFCGVMRELKIIKKENFIFEKRIENLYTLIERIKSCHKQD